MPTNSSNQQVIGTVSSLSGNVYLENQTGKSLLAQNSEVYSDSVVVTESGSSASIRFADETVLALGENSRVTLDDYVFGTSAESNLLFEMGQGSFRMITGKIADQNPEQFNIKTPLASIGIRGTDFSIVVMGENEQFLLNEIDPNHILIIQDEFGTLRFINAAGMIVTIQEGEPLSLVRLATEAEIAEILSLTPSITSFYEKDDSEGESGVDQNEGQADSDTEGDTESDTEGDQKDVTETSTETKFYDGNIWLVNNPFGDFEALISSLILTDTNLGFTDVDQFIEDLTVEGLTVTPIETIIAVNTAPVFTSTAAKNIAENNTVVLNVAANDADGQTPTYAISGGADEALFNINTVTGALSFNAGPDFDVPGDVGGDNVYNLDVTANDGVGGTTLQSIAVTVTDVVETITGTAAVNNIVGTANDDIIIGMGGADNLTGGGGNDIFTYTAEDQFTDVITDFNATGTGDKIHIDIDNALLFAGNAFSTAGSNSKYFLQTDFTGATIEFGLKTFKSNGTANSNQFTLTNLPEYISMGHFNSAFTAGSAIISGAFLNTGRQAIAFGLVATGTDFKLVGRVGVNTFGSSSAANTFPKTLTFATFQNVTGVATVPGVNQIAAADIIIY